MSPWRLQIPAIIGEVTPESAADDADLFSGDRIVSIAGEEVKGWSWIGYLVQTHGKENQPLPMTIERNGALMDIEVTPRKQSSGLFSSRLILGVSNAEISEDQRATLDRVAITLRHGPVDG